MRVLPKLGLSAVRTLGNRTVLPGPRVVPAGPSRPALEPAACSTINNRILTRKGNRVSAVMQGATCSRQSLQEFQPCSILVLIFIVATPVWSGLKPRHASHYSRHCSSGPRLNVVISQLAQSNQQLCLPGAKTWNPEPCQPENNPPTQPKP